MAIEVTYRATGLDDIATMLEQRADQADKRGEAARNKRARELAAIESATWIEAAELLRATTIVQADNPSNC